MTNDKLREALAALLGRYTGLVNCGDCGNWDPETEDEVIAARAALAAPVEAEPVARGNDDTGAAMLAGYFDFVQPNSDAPSVLRLVALNKELIVAALEAYAHPAEQGKDAEDGGVAP